MSELRKSGPYVEPFAPRSIRVTERVEQAAQLLATQSLIFLRHFFLITIQLTTIELMSTIASRAPLSGNDAFDYFSCDIETEIGGEAR